MTLFESNLVGSDSTPSDLSFCALCTPALSLVLVRSGKEPLGGLLQAGSGVQQLREWSNPTECIFEAYRSLVTMRTRLFLMPASLFLLSIVPPARAQTAKTMDRPAVSTAESEVFDHVVAAQKKSDAALDLYERTERVEIRKTLAETSSPEIKTTRVIPNGTGMFKIAVTPDGKPADASLYHVALEKLERALELVASGDRSQRDGLEKYAKRKKDRSDLIEATRNAFLYTFVDREPRGDRTLSKYTMLPNPAYKATSRTTAIFAKVHGFVWIDDASGQLARVEGEVTEDITIGLFLAKVNKGSHFMQENYEFTPGLWLPSFSQYDFDGRKFFSSFSIHERTFYSNYRYVGPPKEALLAIRAELGKPSPGASAP
jgi:hypothetical protein